MEDQERESSDVSPVKEGQLRPEVTKYVCGWLWVFSHRLFPRWNLRFDRLYFEPKPINLMLVTILMALRVRVAVSLLQTSSGALRDVKIFLISMFAASVINLLRASLLSPTEFNSTDLQNLRAIAVRGLLSTMIWALYFQKSRRVRTTFGTNL